jgi:hypothetical protein
VVVVLVAVVGLFVVALVLPARSGSGGSDLGKPPGGLVGLLGNRFGGTADVDRTAVSSGCLQPNDRLVFAGGCALSVSPGSGGLRIVRLHTSSSVHLTTRAPNSDLEISKDVKAGKDVSVAVDDEGGTIALTCAGFAQSCTVTVEFATNTGP